MVVVMVYIVVVVFTVFVVIHIGFIMVNKS